MTPPMVMDTKEAETLIAAHQLEDVFWGLVKRRFVITGLAVLVIGAGVVLVAVETVVQRAVETPLRELQKEVIRAEVQADAAKRANEAAATSSEQVTAAATALNTTLKALAERANAIDIQFNRVTEQINATSENASLRSQRDFNALQNRIAGLEVLVKKIGEENAATRKAAAEYASQVATLGAKVEREQKRFAENSAYTVSVFFDPSRRAIATELQGRLTALGFRAPILEVPGIAVKGKNLLTYHGESEAKAQEVLGLVKPLVKDLQLTKAPEIVSKSTTPYKSGGKVEFFPGGALIDMLGGFHKWNLDPKNLQLALGAN
jgi:hypothetical protein